MYKKNENFPTFSAFERAGAPSQPPETWSQSLERVGRELKSEAVLELGLDPEETSQGEQKKIVEKHEARQGQNKSKKVKPHKSDHYRRKSTTLTTRDKKRESSKESSQGKQRKPAKMSENDKTKVPRPEIVDETIEYVTFVNGEERKIHDMNAFISEGKNRREPKIKEKKEIKVTATSSTITSLAVERDEFGLIHLNSAAAVSEFIAKEQTVAVLYGSKMCGACTEHKALYSRIAKRYKEKLPKLKLVYVDIDKANLVTTIPTVRTWYQGKKTGESVGGGRAGLDEMHQLLVKLKEKVSV